VVVAAWHLLEWTEETPRHSWIPNQNWNRHHFKNMSFALTFYSLLVMWCNKSLTFNNCTFCPHYIYVFCIYVRTNSNLCHIHHKPIGLYNRDGKCLLRGMDWVFKYISSMRFIFKGLMEIRHTESVSFLHFSTHFYFISTIIKNIQEIYKKVWLYERFIL
jgi:hypothetical protein